MMLHNMIQKINEVNFYTHMLGSGGKGFYVMSATAYQGNNQLIISKQVETDFEEVLNVRFHINDQESMRKASRDMTLLINELEEVYYATA